MKDFFTISDRKLMRAWQLVALLLGMLELWYFRNYIRLDGITYLDMSDALMQGDWKTGINAFWYPIYPLILGVFQQLLGPSAYWQYFVVHVSNFFLYVLALMAFQCFLKQLLKFYKNHVFDMVRPESSRIPDKIWISFGHLLFIWTSLYLTKISEVTPDLLIEVLILCVFVLLLKVSMGESSKKVFVAMGILLGIGFLTKAFMLYLSVLVVCSLLILLWKRKENLWQVTITVLFFVVLALPYVVKNSMDKGFVTYGENGRINTIFHINEVTPLFHWRGGPEGNGHPVHPLNALSEKPLVFEYASPISGTYPLWYDPSYYYEGATLQFAAKKHCALLLKNLRKYSSLFFDRQPALLMGLLILFLYSRRKKHSYIRFKNLWFLFAPCLFVLAGYFFVYIDWRYMGPFVLVFFLGLYSCICLEESPASQRVFEATFIVICLMMAKTIVFPSIEKGRAIITEYSQGLQHEQWQIAEGVKKVGVKEGDHIAFIGDASSAAFWARLAKLRITAEVPPTAVLDYQALNVREENKLLMLIKNSGVKAVCTNRFVPSTSGWQKIEKTQHYIYLFP